MDIIHYRHQDGKRTSHTQSLLQFKVDIIHYRHQDRRRTSHTQSLTHGGPLLLKCLTSCVPWEKFMRAMFMPSMIIFWSMGTSRVTGPATENGRIKHEKTVTTETRESDTSSISQLNTPDIVANVTSVTYKHHTKQETSQFIHSIRKEIKNIIQCSCTC